MPLDARERLRRLTGVDAVMFRDLLHGLTLANNGATSLDFAAGACIDETDRVVLMKNAATVTKKLDTAFAVGSGNGGLFTGAMAGSTWYHAFAIWGTQLEFGFDTSVTAANRPSGYQYYRRLGAIRTNAGNTAILSFIQDGDYFRWAASILDVSVTNPGTAAVTRTLTVPTGINVHAIFNVTVTQTTTAINPFAYISDLAATDEAPSPTAAPLGSTPNVANTANLSNQAAMLTIRTNTSAQIRTRHNASDANTSFYIATLGWLDSRGRTA